MKLADYRALNRARLAAWDRLQRWTDWTTDHNAAHLAYCLAVLAWENATAALTVRCGVCRQPAKRCRFGAPSLCSCWRGVPC